MTRPKILYAAKLPEATRAELNTLFDVIELPADEAAIPAFLRAHGSGIRGMALRKTRVDAAFLDALPVLEVISSYSAGLDNLDAEHAKARGILVENTSHVLAQDVANTAIALVLAVTRDIVRADAYVRSGAWAQNGDYPFGRSISWMKVGVVGLGAIGAAIARRLQALGADVSYSGPNRKPVDLPYYPDVAEMARDCDLLVLTCPLTADTHHLVDATVLDNLGPRGLVVNVSRGPVVDEAALIAALAENRIAGAALDVFEFEPQVPEALTADPRVVLTPHIGSATLETRQAMADNVVDVLARHFGIPGPRG